MAEPARDAEGGPEEPAGAEPKAPAPKEPAGAGPSALARKTAAGAMWTVATGIGSRVFGLIGTFVLTRFIAPDIYGDVSAAQGVVLTAHFATSLGLGQYIVSQSPDRQSTFNATVYYTAAGLTALAVIFLLRSPIAGFFGAPGMIPYMPGLAIAVILERLAYIPDRLMIRDMRFRGVGIRNTVGELTYTGVSVALAVLGWGGTAIIVASVLRAAVRLMITVPAVSLREWLTVSPLSREKTRRMLSFGLPLTLGSLANFGAQRWDNLAMIGLFGSRVGGLYTLAWNVADIPASQVGERIGDVLVPSFAKLEPERRSAALIRSLTLLSLLIFPLAVGLGAVAETVFNNTVFDEKWEPAGALLAALSALGITRPVGWVISSYLQVHGRTRLIMVLEWLKVLCLIGGIYALGRLGGQIWACGGVGLAFGLHALGSLYIVRRLDGISYGKLLLPLLGPLLACVPMVAAVLAVRYGLKPLGHLPRGVRLTAEVLTGGVVFVLAALVFARKAARDFLQVVKDVLRRRR